MYAGMAGVWVNRQDEPPGLQPFDGDPDLEVTDFHGLADHLGA
jgi:FMN phosphatase YigB (HAD superfamily)